MREVSCLPVKSDEEILTGAPRCNRILTFRSRSIPDTGRGEVFADKDSNSFNFLLVLKALHKCYHKSYLSFDNISLAYVSML